MLPPGWDAALLASVLGLLIGSFLNVVIHRLPRMLERRWAADCAELLGHASESGHTNPAATPAATPATPSAGTAAAAAEEPFNLMRPRSRCPHCDHTIAWHENIPVLSYLRLRGRCSACAAPIGWRYPAVELLTGALFAACALRWGLGAQGALWAGFGAALIALAAIDWDTTLLPDDITLPLLWAGLLATAVGLNAITLSDAVWGAAVGYLSLWSVFWGFKLLTGKDGMGYGDFKLFAAIGAWMGWQALIPVLLMASVVGAVIGIALKVRGGLREGGVMPFGPFLALGGLTAMAVGPQRVLSMMGI